MIDIIEVSKFKVSKFFIFLKFKASFIPKILSNNKYTIPNVANIPIPYNPNATLLPPVSKKDSNNISTMVFVKVRKILFICIDIHRPFNNDC